MEVLYKFFVGPFVEMWNAPLDLIQAVIDGSMVGIMYSLVALGFALIYKASGVFNFAQGIMVVFAVFCVITFNSFAPNWLLVAAVICVIVTLAVAITLRKFGVTAAAYVAVVAGLAFAASRYFSTAYLIAAAVVIAGPLFWFARQRVIGIAAAAAYSVVGILCVAASAVLGPMFLVLFLSVFTMFVLSVTIERLVLRPLVGAPELILFMATIGLTFFLEGFGETLFGGANKAVPHEALFIPKGRIDMFGGQAQGGLTIQKLELTAAIVSGIMVALLAIMFRWTAIGRALRAVADDHQAALTVGIPLNMMWIVVWTVAGVVALVTGIFWGISSGSADFSLAVIALKALPVLILGGFTSVPGVIVGGFIIGIGEKVAELYWGDLLGGTIEEWFAYVLALVILLFRPQGLFGEKFIERV